MAHMFLGQHIWSLYYCICTYDFVVYFIKMVVTVLPDFRNKVKFTVTEQYLLVINANTNCYFIKMVVTVLPLMIMLSELNIITSATRS